ncbi:MAG: hypothetical protein ACREC5_07815 [Thermoplasmata archaeon]
MSLSTTSDPLLESFPGLTALVPTDWNVTFARPDGTPPFDSAFSFVVLTSAGTRTFVLFLTGTDNRGASNGIALRVTVLPQLTITPRGLPRRGDGTSVRWCR